MSICPICKGTKHVQVRDSNGIHTVRCECLLRDNIQRTLERNGLSINFIKDYIEKGRIVERDSWQWRMLKTIKVAHEEKRALKKNAFILSDRGISQVTVLYCLLAVSFKSFKIRDVSEFIDDSFTNKKQELPDVLVLTTKFFTSKNLAAKFVNELINLSKQQGKIILVETTNKIALANDLGVNIHSQDTIFLPSLE